MILVGIGKSKRRCKNQNCNKENAYHKKILPTLSAVSGWDRIYKYFHVERIVATLSRQLGKSGIRVAEYMTEMLPKNVLEQKLHHAIKMAHGQIENFGKDKLKFGNLS